MTEEEAKKKWCPVVHYTCNDKWLISPAGRKAIFDEERSLVTVEDNCIGSHCMAWRWQENIKSTTYNSVERSMIIFYETDAKIYGYCGLAGNP